jgi:predicted dienelactone hydrolase
MRGSRLCGSVLSAVIALSIAVAPQAAEADKPYPVGIRQVEFADQHYGPRTLSMTVFYPAVIEESSAKPLGMPFFTKLKLYQDARIADADKRPLVMLSHGRGSTGLSYAWFAQTLASRGYIVAAPYHWRANSYDSTVAYLANKLWQRPVDVSLDIDFLLGDPAWSKSIDAQRIGVAGHSQGGFTALWLGGAKVNRDKYLGFQRGWKSNQQIPAHLRDALPLDPEPALNVKDPRVKAVFAMAPGIIKAFGMDEEGLKQLDVPAYITVGEGDTQTPPKENAEFAAKYIPKAELVVIPGASTTRSSSMNATKRGRTNSPRPAGMRRAWTALRFMTPSATLP